MIAVQELLMAWVQPWKIEGMARGIATLKTSCRSEAPKVLAASKYSGSTLEIPVIEATVTANQEPSAIINMAPWNREDATTIMIGIQVEVGIGPKNLMI